MIWRNWSRTVSARPVTRHAPGSEAELVAVLTAAHREHRRVRVVGAGHSCSAIAVGDGADLVSLDRLAQIVRVDRPRRRVTFEAGATLRAVNARLAALGLALPNLPAIDAPTLGGAIATGTHGSGMAFGGISECVVGVRLATPSGDVLDIDDAETLDAVRVHLGCLGVITQITLDCVEAFDLECREVRLSLDDVVSRLDTLARHNFGFWWFPHVDHVIARSFEQRPPCERPRDRVKAWWSSVVIGNVMHEAMLYASARGVGSVAAVNERWLQAVIGPLGHERRAIGPSARMLTSTILVRQRVLEYAVPYERAAAAIAALRELIARGGFAVHAPIDVRFSRAETAWLGLAHGHAVCYLGIVAYRPFGRDVDLEPWFRAADELLRAHEGRPHWGKVHYQTAATLRALYPRFDDFVALRDRLDPHQVLVNPYVRRVLGVPA